MTEKTNLASTPRDDCALSVNECVHPKFKGVGISESLLRVLKIRSRGRDQLSASEQRVFIHIQTKNKHPHSTKKHK
jgi:hypothetical protein